MATQRTQHAHVPGLTNDTPKRGDLGIDVGKATREGVKAVLAASPQNAQQVFSLLIQGWHDAGFPVYAKTKKQVYLRLSTPGVVDDHTFALATLVAPQGKRTASIKFFYPLTLYFEHYSIPRIIYESSIGRMPSFSPHNSGGRILVDSAFTQREAGTLLKTMLKLARSSVRATTLDRRLPAWAGAFSAAEYDLFRRTVVNHAQQYKGLAITHDGVIDRNDPDINIRKLANACREKPEREWPIIVATFLKSLGVAGEERARIHQDAGDLEKVKEHLAVALWTEETLNAMPADTTVSKRLLAGTAAVLVYDLPFSATPVKPEEVARWGKSREELFSLAMDNVIARYAPRVYVSNLSNGRQVFLLREDNSFVASHAFAVTHHPQFTGTKGSLVAIPSRNTVLCCPLEEGNARDTAQGMIPMLLEMHKREPEPLTSHLYWYCPGEGYRTILYSINPKSKRIDIAIPQELEGGRTQGKEEANNIPSLSEAEPVGKPS